MTRFYNIQAGYALAHRAVAAMHDELEGFDYFEDFVQHDSPNFTYRVMKPRRHSLLHVFLEGLEVESLEGDLYDISPFENFSFLAAYARVAGGEMPSWFTPEQVDSHTAEVKVLFPQLARTVAWAAFEILFNDREFLHTFELRLSEAMQRSDTPHPSECYTLKGTVRRCRLPVWLKTAVFFRDHGVCQQCAKDVSGLLNISNKLHLDHVLPLACFGTNDPTNFQLLCEECNLAKSGKDALPENHQTRFWKMEDGEQDAWTATNQPRECG